jgi:hypothetical protein
MLFFHLNILKNRLIKILNFLVSFSGVILKKTFNKVLFKDQDIIYDKDGLEYWKSRIFYIISIFFIICGAPLLFYGAYLFYILSAYLYSYLQESWVLVWYVYFLH